MSKKRFAPKMKIKKGDTVQVIAGAYKGKEGSVLEVLAEKNRVVVEGVNVMKKHTNPSNANPGGINEITAPIHACNVALVDPKSGEPSRVGRKVENGKIVRYSKKSGEILR